MNLIRFLFLFLIILNGSLSLASSLSKTEIKNIDSAVFKELKSVCYSDKCYSYWEDKFKNCATEIKCKSVTLDKIKTFIESKRYSSGVKLISNKINPIKVTKRSNPEITENTEKKINHNLKKLDTIKHLNSKDIKSNIQTKTLKLAKEKYLENCKTLDCVKTIENNFEEINKDLSDTILTNIQSENNSKTDKSTNRHLDNIPEEVINIYKKEGPYSEEMINYFRSNPEIIYKKEELNLAKKNKAFQESLNCTNALIKDICEKYLSQMDTIHHITNYFSYTVVNGPNGTKNIVPGAGYELSKSIPSGNVPHGLYCMFIPSRLPNFEQDSKNSLFISPEGGVTGRNLSDCEVKMKPLIDKFNEKLASLGNPPSGYTITVSDPRKEYLGPYRKSMKGNCYGYIFMPPKDELAKDLNWYVDKSNDRIIDLFDFKNISQKQCDYEKMKLKSKLDPSRYHDISYFLGSVLSERSSSKVKYRNPRPSRPVCKFSYRDMNRRIQTRESNLSLGGNCNNFCEGHMRSLEDKKHSELKCELAPNILEMVVSSRTQNFYKISGEENKKLCEHYNYETSLNPILKFYATSEDDCIKPEFQEKSYVGLIEKFFNGEVKYDGKSILRGKRDVSCTASYGGSTKGYVPSETKTVGKKDEWYSMCKEYHQKITPLARDSVTWIECKANNILINFDYFTDLDPLIVISPESPKMREEVLQNYFESE